MDFNYTYYDHEGFNHLRFEVLDEWILEQNGLEVVFITVDGSLPQLHFQTVGKTGDFNSAESFYNFLLEEGIPGKIKDRTALRCSAFDSIEYEHFDKDYEDIYIYGLIVDVGEGVLWFYLKVPVANFGAYKSIRTNICRSLEFK